MNKLIIFVFISLVGLASVYGARSARDQRLLDRLRVRYARCILENCATEYASFRDFETSQREQCYSNCNPQDHNTSDRNVSLRERREIRRCLANDRCFKLNIYDYADFPEFQQLRECADSRCPRQLRFNERLAQRYRDRRNRRGTRPPNFPPVPDPRGGNNPQVPDPRGGNRPNVPPTPDQRGGNRPNVPPTPDQRGGNQPNVPRIPGQPGGNQPNLPPTPDQRGGGTQPRVPPTPDQRGGNPVPDPRGGNPPRAPAIPDQEDDIPNVSTLLPDGISTITSSTSYPGERPAARPVPPRTVTPRTPANPANPRNPVDPSNPANPRTPANPRNPIDPTNPVNPRNPVDPANPPNPATPRAIPARIVTPGITSTPRSPDEEMLSTTVVPDQFINWISWINVFD